MKARLRIEGTLRQPELHAAFDREAEHAQKPGHSLIDFIKSMPSRRWSPDDGEWIITGTGINPQKRFTRAGFTIDLGDDEFADIIDLDDLVEPVSKLAKNKREVFIRPRLLGYEPTLALLGLSASWDRERQRFTIPVADILRAGQPIEGIDFDDETIEAARDAKGRVRVDEAVAESVTVLASAKDSAEAGEHMNELIGHVGDVPDWFGLDLFAYQRLGALAAASGQGYIADEPGLGKCVVGQSRVETINGGHEIQRLWAARQRRSYVDPDGDNGELIDLSDNEITVLSIDASTGQSRWASASHLYRQSYRGRMFTIDADNGTRLTCSPRHKFLTPSGWKMASAIVAGTDEICVPNHLGQDESSNTTSVGVTSVHETQDFRGFIYDLTIPSTRSYVAEGMWVHNTRSALAAAAIVKPSRVVVVGPPVSLTNWERETTFSGLAHACAGAIGRDVTVTESGQPKDDGGFSAAHFPIHGDDGEFEALPINKIVSSRKVKDFPEAGIVIVSDDMLRSRPQVLSDLQKWSPEVLIVDEIHRQKTWEAGKSTAVRRLSYATQNLTIGLSGTPLDGSPDQLANQLEITGHLSPVFGGKDAFLNEYCSRNRFNAFMPVKKKLPKLGRILDAHVWVRRTKGDVLPFLPKKTRRVEWIDVPMRDYRQAHRELLMKIGEVAAEFHETKGRWPSVEALMAELPDLISLSSPLRRAAGMAKVDIVSEATTEHLESTTEADDDTYDRPLITWVHHKDVAEAMMDKLAAEKVPDVRLISGKTGPEERDGIIDSFQAGGVGVLIASITAANTAITLTRSSDMIFAETDWRPPQISQAEDRAARIGQTRPVIVTAYAAVDTLDERLHASLETKGSILEDVVVGGDNMVTTGTKGAAMSLTDIIVDVVDQAIIGEKKGKLAQWRAERATAMAS